ncbi:SGNH/GDSL hydrolase family protein [Actinokineospora sp. 24-640]
MRRFAVIACAVVIGMAVAGQPAGASAEVHYVALGDSYSSGSGAGNYSGDCRRSDNAYARLWAAEHQPASFTFAACTGATTDDVLGGQLNEVSSKTTLVSITVGGNDIGFADVLTECTLSGDAACASAAQSAADRARADLPARLDTVYAAVRDRAPDARLVVLGYPRLFADGAALCVMSQSKRRALNDGANVLADITAARAAAAGAVYEDVRDDFAGHEICSGSSWINAVTWPISDSYHPNKTGHASGYLSAFAKVAG